MKSTGPVVLCCCLACFVFLWVGQAGADETAAKKQDGAQSQAQSQDERAINEILRLGGQYWNSPRGPSLPKRAPWNGPTRNGTRGQQVAGSNTPPHVAQPPLLRAYLSAATTDESLRFFSGLSQLEFLYLDGSQVTDAGLSHLKDLPKLENISLRRTQIGDAGLANLKVLSQFGTMSLQDTKITDEGVKLLSKQTKLQRLFLDNTAITDVGLKYLEDLPNLAMLTLDGTKVTEQGKKDFQKKHPGFEFGRPAAPIRSSTEAPGEVAPKRPTGSNVETYKERLKRMSQEKSSTNRNEQAVVPDNAGTMNAMKATPEIQKAQSDRCVKREKQDAEKYTPAEIAEMANAEDNRSGWEMIIKKYPDSNLAGCSYLALGMMTSTNKESYLKKAMNSDCYLRYQKQVAQVKPLAMLYLADHYAKTGKKDEALKLLMTIQQDFPNAVMEDGESLIIPGLQYKRLIEKVGGN